MARICAARSPVGASGEAAEQEGVVEQHDAARAQVVGRPVEVAGIALLVGVDEHEIERPARRQRGQDVGGHADVNAGARRDAGAAEALARDLGVLRRQLDGVELAVRAHPAQQRDAGIAAQRSDLDGPPGAGRAREHLQVQGVERRDLDVGQARPRRCARGSRPAPGPRARTTRATYSDSFGSRVAERLVHRLTLPGGI